MSTSITNRLQSLIAQASNQKSDGEVTRLRRRQQGATDAVVILADASDSMGNFVGSRRKIEILRDALAQIWPQSNATLIAFSSLPSFLPDPSALPAPFGSTALHLAIDAAQSLKPARTLVISDGQPDEKQAAIEAADKLTGQIDVIYCGSDSDLEAIAFMRQLARRSGGRCVVTPQNAARFNLIEPVRRLLLLTE